MKTRFLFFVLVACLSFTSCMNSRYTTHWIVNNDSEKDVSLNVTIGRSGSGHTNTTTHTISPGLHEMGSQKLRRGRYSVLAATAEVSKTSQIHAFSDTWVIINFTNEDSIRIKSRYGFVDTSELKKINGKYTGLTIHNETRQPPMLYMMKARK